MRSNQYYFYRIEIYTSRGTQDLGEVTMTEEVPGRLRVDIEGKDPIYLLNPTFRIKDCCMVLEADSNAGPCEAVLALV